MKLLTTLGIKMDCCNKNDESFKTSKMDTKFTCPKCSNIGIIVELITPKSLLKDDYKIQVRAESIYKFCKYSNCDVAYFTKDLTHYFLIDQLKEKVTLKDQGLDVLVCFCFGHTRQSILSELQMTGETKVLEDVKSKMKDPGCFCERSNPQGGCCLGNITSWIKEAKTLCSDKKLV